MAVASADVREKRGILSYAAPGAVVQGPSSIISGPSGTIVSDTGAIATNAGLYGAPVVARSAYAPGVIASPLGYAASPLAYAASPLAYSAYAPSVYSAAVAPGVTAGTVYAPGTTLVGPSTNGAPGAVITNSPYGAQIYV